MTMYGPGRVCVPEPPDLVRPKVWVSRFKGYTYPHLFSNRLVHAIWRALFCRRGWHLWDEVESIDSHYLFCDACEVSFGDDCLSGSPRSSDAG